ncbi:MAG: RT0821/Lpp0805 family surface protein [Pseudomonadota bacterium]
MSKNKMLVKSTGFGLIVAGGLLLSACSSSYTRTGDQLTDFDRQLIVQATTDALEFNKIGESTNWENETSGHVGSVTPTATFDDDPSRPCRNFRQTLGVGDVTTTAYDRACRDADGSWSSANYETLTSALSDLRLGADGREYARRPYPYYPRYRYGYGYGGPYYGYGYRYGRYGGGSSFGFGYRYGW